MSEPADRTKPPISFDADLAEPPAKVWRAVSDPVFRALWLPEADLASPEPETTVPGREARYRMREAEPPFLESVVTFHVAPNGSGGTRLRVLHELTDARTDGRTLRPANANGPLMRAA